MLYLFIKSICFILRSVRNFLTSASSSGVILSNCPSLRPLFFELALIPSLILLTVISRSFSALSNSVTRSNLITTSNVIPPFPIKMSIVLKGCQYYWYPFSFCPLYQSDFSPLNLHGCPTENSNMRLSAFYQYFPNLSSEFVCYVCATRMCYASKLTTFLENFQNSRHKKNPEKSRDSGQGATE